MKRLLWCFLCLVVLCASAEQAGLQLQEKILAYEMQTASAKSVQEWIDGTLSEHPSDSAAWYVIGLAQRGAYDFSAYRAALMEYLQNNTVRSQVTRQKYALALLAVGGDRAAVTEILSSSIGKQGLMSWVYGLHLMNNGIVCEEATVQQVIDKLLSLQLPDGGWVITGSVSDADVTAMTVQALSPYYAENEKVRAAVDRAVQCMADMQLSDGSFASYGKANAESTAQVWMALSSLGINALEDARFIKAGNTLLDGLMLYQLQDDSFCHTMGGDVNQTATVQAYLAAAAYAEMLRGEGSILMLLDAESAENAYSTELKTALDYKAIASIVISVLAVIVCVLLLILKKRSSKNYIAVLLIASALIGVVQLTDIQSAEDYYSVSTIEKKDVVGTVTLIIRCDTLIGKTQAAHIPADGEILAETTFALDRGETVYDVLLEATRTHALHMESSGAKGLRYVSGIANLYEYDFGDLSGWLYYVNGESFSEGCDSYKLKDGDQIAWLYTCEMGEDLK